MVKNSGLIYVFTGEGKGKTSAALGVAMRAVGQGKRVAMVQWYKQQRTENRKQRTEIPTWQIGEHRLPELLKKPLFKIYPMGQGFYKLPTDHATPAEHKKAAQAALDKAKKLLSTKKYFLLVLDEVLNAISDGLISQISLIRLIQQRNATHIILTGRNCPKKLIDIADLVTEMKKVKHPYDSGKKAVLGLDY